MNTYTSLINNALKHLSIKVLKEETISTGKKLVLNVSPGKYDLKNKEIFQQLKDEVEIYLENKHIQKIFQNANIIDWKLICE